MVERDPFELEHFAEAQANVIARVKDELRAGRKQSHWMWFIFPQLAGLGFSPMAQRYAISSLAEARAYLAHPLLGARLRECTELVLAIHGKSAHAIFGSPDDLKFRSCLSLFAEAAPDEIVFNIALAKYFAGAKDPRTLSLLRNA
jgi:uncharacterized protein (DUF1810 family)